MAIDDGKRLSARVSLTGYVDVVEVRTLGGTSYMDGNTSWGGRITESSEMSLIELAGRRVHLTFPDGQVRVAAIRNTLGNLEGTGSTPF
jgi:hypothetical protein